MADIIDIHDLPEEQANLIQEFVEFLRNKLKRKQISEEDKDKEWGEAAMSSFAKDWENEKDAIYDNWKERYHVR